MIKLAYIVSRFPKTTETFILNEVKCMRESGLDVTVYPLLNRIQRIHHGSADVEAFTSRANHPVVEGVSSTLFWLVRKPLTVASLVGSVVKELSASPKILLKTIVLFPRFLSIAKHCRLNAIDHVHCGFASYAGTAGLVAYELASVDYSLTGHANDLFRTKGLLRLKARHCRRFFVISRFNIDYLTQLVDSRDVAKLQLIRAGANTGAFAYREVPPESRHTKILCVASFVEKKGHRYLIEAVDELIRSGISVHCDLVGEGPLRAKLEELVAGLNLSAHVTFHGALRQDQVHQFMLAADTFVLPCVQSSDGVMDGIPVAIMEAMASGVPVVTTNVSGIPELVQHEVTGLIAKPGDAHDLAEQIRRLVSDSELSGAIVPAANKVVREEYDAFENYRKKASGIAALVATV